MSDNLSSNQNGSAVCKDKATLVQNMSGHVPTVRVSVVINLDNLKDPIGIEDRLVEAIRKRHEPKLSKWNWEKERQSRHVQCPRLSDDDRRTINLRKKARNNAKEQKMNEQLAECSRFPPVKREEFEVGPAPMRPRTMLRSRFWQDIQSQPDVLLDNKPFKEMSRRECRRLRNHLPLYVPKNLFPFRQPEVDLRIDSNYESPDEFEYSDSNTSDSDDDLRSKFLTELDYHIAQVAKAARPEHVQIVSQLIHSFMLLKSEGDLDGEPLGKPNTRLVNKCVDILTLYLESFLDNDDPSGLPASHHYDVVHGIRLLENARDESQRASLYEKGTRKRFVPHENLVMFPIDLFRNQMRS